MPSCRCAVGGLKCELWVWVDEMKIVGNIGSTLVVVEGVGGDVCGSVQFRGGKVFIPLGTASDSRAFQCTRQQLRVSVVVLPTRLPCACLAPALRLPCACVAPALHPFTLELINP
jgi:hypothetical protein